MEDYLVTVEDLQKIVDFKTQKPVVHPFRFGEDMTKIVVKPFISLANYADMIKNIVAACVINGDYYVAFRDFAIKSNLLIYFTNITAGDADIVYSFIHSCPDTVDVVIKDIDKPGTYVGVPAREIIMSKYNLTGGGDTFHLNNRRACALLAA